MIAGAVDPENKQKDDQNIKDHVPHRIIFLLDKLGKKHVIFVPVIIHKKDKEDSDQNHQDFNQIQIQRF